MKKSNHHVLIDWGNTACKVAFAKCKEIETIVRNGDGESPEAFIKKILNDELFDVIAFSSVQQYDRELVSWLASRCHKLVVVDGDTPTALRIDYQTTDRLGADLLAGGLGAVTRFPGEDIVVMDLGTAITVESINKEGWLVGVNISPGLQARFTALHQSTHALPLIKLSEGEDIPDYGIDTWGAMAAGVVLGIIHEIEGYIVKNQGKRIILTGGDAIFFAKKLKTPIFVDCNLIFSGLIEIADSYAE